MHIEDIFEDLEAQFYAAMQKSQRNSYTDDVRAIEIHLANNVKKELVAPILGKNFVAGLDALSPIWHFFPVNFVQKITLHSDLEETLPKLRNLAIDLESLLKSLPFPSQIRWRLALNDEHLSQGVMTSISNGLIYISSVGAPRPMAVPVLALSQLSVESVDNLNGVF